VLSRRVSEFSSLAAVLSRRVSEFLSLLVVLSRHVYEFLLLMNCKCTSCLVLNKEFDLIKASLLPTRMC
jgi:hypothetical protein